MSIIFFDNTQTNRQFSGANPEFNHNKNNTRKKKIPITEDIRNEISQKVSALLNVDNMSPEFKKNYRCSELPLSTISTRMGLHPSRLESIINPHPMISKERQSIFIEDLKKIREFSDPSFLHVKKRDLLGFNKKASLPHRTTRNQKTGEVMISKQLRQEIKIGTLQLENTLNLSRISLNEKIGLPYNKLAKIAFYDENNGGTKSIRQGELNKIQSYFKKNLSPDFLNNFPNLFPPLPPINPSNLYSNNTYVGTTFTSTLTETTSSFPSSELETSYASLPHQLTSTSSYVDDHPWTSRERKRSSPSSLIQLLELNTVFLKETPEYDILMNTIEEAVEKAIDINGTQFEKEVKFINDLKAKESECLEPFSNDFSSDDPHLFLSSTNETDLYFLNLLETRSSTNLFTENFDNEEEEGVGNDLSSSYDLFSQYSQELMDT